MTTFASASNPTVTRILAAKRPIVRAAYLADNGATAQIREDAHRWIDANPEHHIIWSGVPGTGF